MENEGKNIEKYRMLDLFSGLGGAHQAMEEDSKWDVITVDNKEKFEPDICSDVLELESEDFERGYDLIWASPPCTCFSLSSLSHYWNKGLIPTKKKVSHHVKLAYYTLYLINELNPLYWFLENPRGMMRKVLPIKPAGTVTYCQYGKDYMKPTDLYGNHPHSFVYKKCKSKSDCHKSNPRDKPDTHMFGSNPEKQAVVPYELSKAIKESVENPESKNKLEAFC